MTTYEYASAYAEAGLSVLPISCDGSKSPDGDRLPKNSEGKAEWLSLQDAIPTLDQLHHLFRGELVGVGIIGGKVSGCLEIIDIDDPALVQPFYEEVEAVCPGLMARL